MMKLKICGMKYPDNIQEIAGLNPDYLGFIFYEKSPRNFDGPPFTLKDTKAVGVFVNASQDTILQKIKQYGLMAVQLHGEESPAFCEALRERFLQDENKMIEIIKVFSVGDSFDFCQLDTYEGKVDYFLFDTKSHSRGGSGVAFNWKLLLDYKSATPFFLSGGIRLEETDSIIALVHELKQRGKAQLLYGLDVNSRFETEPGRKQLHQLQEFKKKLESLLINNEHEL